MALGGAAVWARSVVALLMISGLLAVCGDSLDSGARCPDCADLTTALRLRRNRGIFHMGRTGATAEKRVSLEAADLSEEGGAKARRGYTREALRFREAVGTLAGDSDLLKSLWHGDNYCSWPVFRCKKGKPVRFILDRTYDTFNVTKLPDDMFESPIFSELERISIEWNLKELPHSLLTGAHRPRFLKTLALVEMSVSDLTPLSGLSPSIESLSLSGLGLLRDISVVGHMPKLKHLQIYRTGITNIPRGVVSGCMMTGLFVSYNLNLISIHGLGELESADTIEIAYNPLLRSLPEDFGAVKIRSLRVFRLALLNTLPPSLQGSTTLKYLGVERCGLTGFAPDFTLPSSLIQVSLRYNSIQYFPDRFFANSVRLSTLELSFNPIRSLPASVPLGSMISFSCEHCPLSALPERIDLWKHLDKLTISYHRMTSLPLAMNNMTRLMSLAITDGPLADLPAEFGAMRLLNILDLSRNRLSSLPISINGLSELRTLLASGNNLAAVPSLSLRKLMKLDLSSNSLNDLPDLSKCSLLRNIDASRNMIKKVAGLPSVLTRLSIQENQLSRFDSDAVLPMLTHLYAQQNMLVEMPTRWPLAGGIMDVSNNRLTTLHIPTGIVVVTAVKNRIRDFTYDVSDRDLSINSFDIAHNELVDFPTSLLDSMAQLKHLSISGNMLTDVSAILQWFNGKRDMVVRLDDNLVSVFPSEAIEVGVRSSLTLDEVFVNGSVTANLLKTSDSSRLLWTSHDHTSQPGRQCHLTTATHRSRTLSLRSCRCAPDFYRVGKGPFGEEGACRPCVGNGHCSDGRIICDSGYILTTMGEPRCERCTSDGIECSDNKARVLPGYWSPYEGALTAFACTHPHLCLGDQAVPGAPVFAEFAEMDESTGNRTCVDGNHGPLCSLCGVGSFPNAMGYCVQCPGIIESILYVASFLVGLTALLALLVLMGKLPGVSANTADAELGAVESGSYIHDESLDGVMQAVKIVIGFVQVLCTFPKLYDVQWGGMFSGLSEMLGWVNLSFLSPRSMECIWENWATTSTPGLAAHYTHVDAMIVTCVLPLMAVLMAVVFAAVWQAVRALLGPKGGVSSQLMWVFCGRFCLLLLLLTYVPASTTALEYFRCRSFDGGATYYVEADLSLQCYDQHWYEYSIVPAIIFACYTVGTPLIIFASLFPGSMRHRLGVARSSSPRHIRADMCWLRLGIAGLGGVLDSLYSTYRKEYRWWDALELLRKVMVTGVAVHCGSVPAFQISVSLIISFVAFAVQQAVRPFSSRMLNLVQTVTLALLFFTLSIGLLESVSVSPALAAQYTATILILDVVVIAVIALKLIMVLLRMVWMLSALGRARV